MSWMKGSQQSMDWPKSSHHSTISNSNNIYARHQPANESARYYIPTGDTPKSSGLSSSHPNRYFQTSAVQRLVNPAMDSVNIIPSKRYLSSVEDDEAPRKKEKNSDKSRGLRHFSLKVSEKVREKGRTTYNEVADELVSEFFQSESYQYNRQKPEDDMKNIRRRVYDALNVLMAMNIISKEKKEIRWIGLPKSSIQECSRLREEKKEYEKRISDKMSHLNDLILQLVSYKSLVEKNRESVRQTGQPSETSTLFVPFIILSSEKRAVIECRVSSDRSQFEFTFDRPYQVHDDIDVLKKLGHAQGLDIGNVSEEKRAKLKEFLPLAVQDYLERLCDGDIIQSSDDIMKEAERFSIATESMEHCEDIIIERGNIKHNVDEVDEDGDSIFEQNYHVPMNETSGHPRQIRSAVLMRSAREPQHVTSRNIQRFTTTGRSQANAYQSQVRQFDDTYNEANENLDSKNLPLF